MKILVVCDYVFWAGRAKIEGRRHADPGIKTRPACVCRATRNLGAVCAATELMRDGRPMREKKAQ